MENNHDFMHNIELISPSLSLSAFVDFHILFINIGALFLVSIPASQVAKSSMAVN